MHTRLPEVAIGARSHCRVARPAHLLHTRFTNVFDASASEPTMRPGPQVARRSPLGAATQLELLKCGRIEFANRPAPPASGGG